MTKKKEEAVSGSKEQRPEGQENARQESGREMMTAMEEEKILDVMKKMTKKLLGKVEIESCRPCDVEDGQKEKASARVVTNSADASREHLSDHERRDTSVTIQQEQVDTSSRRSKETGATRGIQTRRCEGAARSRRC